MSPIIRSDYGGSGYGFHTETRFAACVDSQAHAQDRPALMRRRQKRRTRGRRKEQSSRTPWLPGAVCLPELPACYHVMLVPFRYHQLLIFRVHMEENTHPAKPHITGPTPSVGRGRKQLAFMETEGWMEGWGTDRGADENSSEKQSFALAGIPACNNINIWMPVMEATCRCREAHASITAEAYKPSEE